MTLNINVEKRLGDAHISANLVCGAGLTALFGRSGAGKSSLLNMVAGLTRPDRGRITLDGDDLFDSARGLSVPIHRRRIGYVFQDARLLPHLSVRQNLMFGRWFARRRDRRIEPAEIIPLLGLEHLLARAPHTLSGGEKQRVAIGRAFLTSPRLLLMDEPLASLDDERKQEVLPYIERLRDGFAIPILYVSHAFTEVMRLANAVALIDDGKVAAFGPPESVLRRADVSGDGDEIGALLEAVVVEHDRPNALTVLGVRAAHLYAPAIDAPVGTRVRLRIRARDVIVALRRPEEISALNIIPGRIVSMQDVGQAGAHVEIDCAGDCIGARLTRKSAQALDLRPGREVFAILKSVTFDASTVTGAPAAPKK